MARRTFTDIDANVAQRLGNRTDDVTSTLRAQWIYDALLRCANEYEHPETEGVGNETLTAATDSVTPTTITDLWWPTMVKDFTNGRIIRPGDKERLENQVTKPTGNPARFYWWNNVFYFNSMPSANTVIRIWYIRKPAEWTSGESMLAVAYDLIIEMYATQNGHNFLREYDKAKGLESIVKDYVKDMNLPTRKAKLNDYMNTLIAGRQR